MKFLVNKLVRFYLYHSPVTDGKKHLLSYTKDFILPDSPAATFKTQYGFSMNVSLKNLEHQHIYFYGTHDERYEIRTILKILRPGDTCWDVGANIGFYTCLFASIVGERGKVVAFEPTSSAIWYLEENIKINRFNNVTLLKHALGDASGSKAIHYASGDMAEGTASLKYFQDKNKSEIVEIETIDNLRSKIPAPDFIKIDVEGYQTEVIEGAREFLTHNEPMIMAEFKGEEAGGELERFLVSLGYSFYEFNKNSIKKCLSTALSKKRNFLLVKEQSPYFQRIKNYISD